AAGNAWLCTVTSIFAIVILSVIGFLFRTGHESMMGSINDPEDGKAVANMIFSAVVLYIVTLLFCGCQAWVHATQRQSIAI
ncbi:hypothetical protein L211DRAFT_780988, partial [Terfezia boudieri ATCC MYA-4762]